MTAQNQQSAGDFSTWLELTRKPDQRGADVPCGECTACCTSSYFIHIQPHETNAMARIPAELLFAAPGLPDGHVVMGYDDHGQCPMFVDGDCSIYDDRPQTCRDYDCRVFAATGIELTDDAKALIVEQTRRWRFETRTEIERAQQSALQACADFLREHAGQLPAGSVPDDPTHLAMLAIDVHGVFIGRAPDLDVVTHAVEASMKRRRES